MSDSTVIEAVVVGETGNRKHRQTRPGGSSGQRTVSAAQPSDPSR